MKTQRNLMWPPYLRWRNVTNMNWKNQNKSKIN